MIHGPKPFSSDIFIFSYIGKRISPSTGIKSLLLLRAVVVTWGFEGVRTERKVRPSKVLQTRGVGECSTPLPPRKKNANLGAQKFYFLPFQRFQLYTRAYVRIWMLRSCEHWRAATLFVIVGVGPGHFIIHLTFLHHDVFRVVRFLSVSRPGYHDLVLMPSTLKQP